MVRKVRHSCFENRTSRLKLTIRPKPYTGPTLAEGVTLLYRRRSQTNGTWVLRVAAGSGQYWTQRFAVADDYDAADGETILTFFQAQDRAKELTRAGPELGAPVTVDAALVRYEADLQARDADPRNARMPRGHLTPALLAKPVSLLTSGELEGWRNSLLGKIKPATVNRVCNALRAALERAARHDRRIQNQSAWKIGLGGLPGAGAARNVYLSENTVHAFVRAAYARDQAFGLLVEVLAQTGTRPSQAVRLRIEDLRDDRLMMPKSGKGGGRNRSQKKHAHFSVPITAMLAMRLKATVAGRAPEDFLLLRADGQPWNLDPSRDYRAAIREIVESLGEDPARVTVYALRHSSIARRLLAGMSVRVCAALHDTSIAMIERSYSKLITEYANEHARLGLLEDPGLVVPIRGKG